MVDFSRVTERLFTGAAISSADDVHVLGMAGVTHIIDARVEFDDISLILSAHANIAYLWNPTGDDGQHPKPVAWFAKAVNFAMEALSHPGAIVHTHCAGGQNRGPSLAYAILRAQGMNRQTAESTLRAARSSVTLAYKDDADAALIALGWVR